MPVIGRLDWIQRQLQMGRRGHISVGAARDDGKCKIKVHLEPALVGPIDPVVCSALNHMLMCVRALVQGGVAMDRGHKHASGISEVSIWVAPPHAEEFSPGDAVANVPVDLRTHPANGSSLRAGAPAFVPSESPSGEQSTAAAVVPAAGHAMTADGHSVLATPVDATAIVVTDGSSITAEPDQITEHRQAGVDIRDAPASGETVYGIGEENSVEMETATSRDSAASAAVSSMGLATRNCSYRMRRYVFRRSPLQPGAVIGEGDSEAVLLRSFPDGSWNALRVSGTLTRVPSTVRVQRAFFEDTAFPAGMAAEVHAGDARAIEELDDLANSMLTAPAPFASLVTETLRAAGGALAPDLTMPAAEVLHTLAEAIDGGTS